MFKEDDKVKIIHLHVNGADGYGVIKGPSKEKDKWKVLTENMVIHIETSRLVLYDSKDGNGNRGVPTKPRSTYKG